MTGGGLRPVCVTEKLLPLPNWTSTTTPPMPSCRIVEELLFPNWSMTAAFSAPVWSVSA
jgi:hypothetical protein